MSKARPHSAPLQRGRRVKQGQQGSDQRGSKLLAKVRRGAKWCEPGSRPPLADPRQAFTQIHSLADLIRSGGGQALSHHCVPAVPTFLH